MKKNAFYIDKITHSIEDAITGRSFDTDVRSVALIDLKAVLKRKGWKFNWKMEMRDPDRQLYKLVIKGDPVIQGLISLHGFEGFVAFKAKTRLIQHYIDTLGAELIFRDRMSISGKSAKKLVNSYYENYFNER